MFSESASTYVNTTQVAKALGLSVSTVKRWVDDGVLPAHKTAGGHRKLLLADVLEIARRGDLPHLDLSLLVETGLRGKSHEPSQLSDELYRALLNGDGLQVRSLIHGVFRQGLSVEELADQVIGPAMAHIGHDWESGRIDVMEEHRASQLCAGSLYELKALLEERASKNRPRAVGGAPEQDHSVLPTLLAQMVLLDAGWEAVNLGPQTPFTSFSRAILELRPELIWLSVSHLGAVEPFLKGYSELYQQAEKARIPVAIGGRALAEEIRSRMPYTAHGDSLTHLAAFARTLNPKPRPPRRGRPPKE